MTIGTTYTVFPDTNYTFGAPVAIPVAPRLNLADLEIPIPAYMATGYTATFLDPPNIELPDAPGPAIDQFPQTGGDTQPPDDADQTVNEPAESDADPAPAVATTDEAGSPEVADALTQLRDDINRIKRQAAQRIEELSQSGRLDNENRARITEEMEEQILQVGEAATTRFNELSESGTISADRLRELTTLVDEKMDQAVERGNTRVEVVAETGSSDAWKAVRDNRGPGDNLLNLKKHAKLELSRNGAGVGAQTD